ncbi:MAG: response regulator [bacterium]
MIEDNPGEAIVIEAALLEGATKTLQRSKIEVSHAGLVSEGIERMRAGDIDVVLLDLSLPDSEGLETLLLLLEEDAGVPIVVLTGTDDCTVATDAMKLGAENYLVKGRVDALGIIGAIRDAVKGEQEKSVERIQS